MNKPDTQAIALGEYTLAGYDFIYHWVLCKSHPSGELEKVFVLRGLQVSDLSEIISVEQGPQEYESWPGVWGRVVA